MKKGIFLIALLAFCTLFPAFSQETDYPLIGAQVFIEPGQTEEDIDGFFAAMESAGMEVGRIRMFGSHLVGEGSAANYALYDYAFDCAENHNIRLFATLFPPTDELTDVGGFKFPESEAHLMEIGEYIRDVVSHFSKKPALYAWVLQNEPGLDTYEMKESDLSGKVRAEFEEKYGKYERSAGYLNADFSDDRFLSYYTTWYLNWIAGQVRKYDEVHYTHVNPHAIFETLPEYDFPAYEEFLTSLGISIHPSWHFGYFDREKYSLGVSVMSDIIRNAAGKNKFWITEMQGGSVYASGRVPLCPTAAEIGQWLWTGVGAGAQGVIFWTLNPRMAVSEAGEWGLLDYLGRPSDRLEKASDVIRTIKEHRDFFKEAEVVKSGVCILYNRESIWTAKANANTVNSRQEGRAASSVMKSVVSAYNSMTSTGIVPEICDFERFSWDSAEYPVAVIPNIIALPEKYVPMIESYVKGGGTLVVTGLSFYYDGDMACTFQAGFPLRECFGGTVSEFKVVDDIFVMERSSRDGVDLTAHLWQGELVNDSGKAIYGCGDKVTGLVNSYGKGTVVWVPSMVDLGSWISGDDCMAAFYRKYCANGYSGYPVIFGRNYSNVLMRLLSDGDTLMAVIVNNNPEDVNVKLEHGYGRPEIIYGDAGVSRTSVRVPSRSVVVLDWSMD